jgi:septal ring factor EnvC (AmiA/AmiB activator)
MKKLVVAAVILFVLCSGIGGYMYITSTGIFEPNDEKLIDSLEDEINDVEEQLDKVEQKETEQETTIDNDVSEDETVLNELQSELDAIDKQLDQIDNAEIELTNEVE